MAEYACLLSGHTPWFTSSQQPIFLVTSDGHFAHGPGIRTEVSANHCGHLHHQTCITMSDEEGKHIKLVGGGGQVIFMERKIAMAGSGTIHLNHVGGAVSRGHGEFVSISRYFGSYFGSGGSISALQSSAQPEYHENPRIHHRTRGGVGTHDCIQVFGLLREEQHF